MIPAQTRTVEQSESGKVTLYINLESLWSDDTDDPDELVFRGAKSEAPWIKILNDPVKWDDIPGTHTWPGSPTGSSRSFGSDPGSGDPWVVVVEIDRTGSNNGQGDSGSFILTARDRSGLTEEESIKIDVTDENLPSWETRWTSRVCFGKAGR